MLTRTDSDTCAACGWVVVGCRVHPKWALICGDCDAGPAVSLMVGTDDQWNAVTHRLDRDDPTALAERSAIVVAQRGLELLRHYGEGDGAEVDA